MPSGDPPDPVRATLVAILQQLNRVEELHAGRAVDQVLELAELERMLSKFWTVDQELVKVSLALGLLVRNGMVEAEAPRPFGAPKPGPQRATKANYHITAAGKQFLVESLQKSDRIA